MSKRVDRRDAILAAALAIADRDGVEGLTLRKIEEDTGLSAPLIYRHFRDKADILHALVERLLVQPPLPAPDQAGPRAWLEAAFRALYERARAHSALLTLLSTTDPLQVNALRLTEGVLEVLQKAGLNAAQSGHAFHLLMAYTVGSVAMARGTQLTNEVLAEAIVRLPNLLTSGPYLDARDERVFERGLSSVLDAIGLPQPERS